VASGVFTPYSTGAEFFGTKPAWVNNDLDAQRILSYQTYEQMYWNVPDIFKVALRGSNNLPVYIPSTRTIIDTTNRYVGADLKVVCVGPDSEALVAAQLAVKDLIKRERYRSKFNGKKRYNLIWGDSIWHLTADSTKPVGSRLRLTSLDPGMYFPITDEDDVDRVIGCHLVDQITTADGPRVRRLTYRKGDPRKSDGKTPITVEEGVFELDKWQTDAAPESVIQALIELPPDITALPVYHTKNTEQPGDPFGSSEVRGLERIMSGVNQTISDEDLAVALQGIGMYATDSDAPVDRATGKEISWPMGPGRVVHYNGTKFDKVAGAQGVDDAFGSHYNRLWEALFRVSSTPEVAVGNIDVSVAQSGVALQLQLGPMLGKAAEKDQLLIDVEAQMWHDIVSMWMPAYEESTFPGIDVEVVTGDAVPIDRVAKFAELNDMLDRGIIDTAFYRVEVAKLGYTFPDGMDVTAAAEFQQRNADQFGTRLASETGNGGTQS
jgi:hypothetical protein